VACDGIEVRGFAADVLDIESLTTAATALWTV
jgi:hypothetical protein